VDVANELFAMAATVSHARKLELDGHPAARESAVLADLFCRGARRRVQDSFRALWGNDDVFKYQVALQVLRGEHAWLERGIVPLERAGTDKTTG